MSDLTAEVVDPKGLIRESYNIEGITKADCRTIFLDWAIQVPGDVDPATFIQAALEIYGADGHPMTEVLNEGLDRPAKTGRRGGRSARVPS